jgi:hypothetical protein
VSRTAIASTALFVLLAGCGGNSESAGEAGSTDSTPGVSGSAAPEPSPAKPDYATLSEGDLTDALLDINDLPAGYSQDPPSKPTPNHTFCNYKTPFDEKVKVRRDFTKGGGMSSQVLSVSLRQYKNADQAKTAFAAMTKALDTCHTETYQGSKLTYALMSAPEVGDDTIGVRMTADGTTILQNFALIGPTLVSTGGAGLTSVDADEIAGLLEDQVTAYDAAATA